mgnify:CR=1 FL=1
MQNNTSSDKNEKSACTSSGFNYCLWAKIIVGVPVVFIVANIASSYFTDPLMQVFGGGAAGILVIYIAMKIDKIPALQKKIIDK